MRFVAVTLLLAACSRAPDMAKCRLVGIWEPEREQSDALVAQLKVDGTDSDPLIAKYVSAFGPDGREGEEEFEPDGKWNTLAWMGDRWIQSHDRWRLISETSDTIT